MALNSLDSVADLEEYCLRRLGKPVINIEVEAQQVCDRIDDAIQYYVERHYDGVEEVWEKYTITKGDVSRGYLRIKDEIVTVIDTVESSAFSREIFENIRFLLLQQDLLDFTQPTVANYYISQEHISTVNFLLDPKRSFNFNRATHRLIPHFGLVEGNFIILHGYKAIDEELCSDMLNDRWLKEYATQLVKRQWGSNLKKFDNVQMPGGVTIKGQEIYDEADARVKELEEEFSLIWELPIDGFVG